MKIKLKTIRKIVLIFSFVLICGGIGYWLGETGKVKSVFSTKSQPVSIKIDRSLPVDKSNLDFTLFWEVWDKLQKSYLEKEDLDSQKMIYGAISGMTGALGDPYTVFLPPSDNQTSKEDLNGEFDGVGIQLGYKDGSKLAVVAPLSGMPAEKAGVKAGDLILHLKDEKKGLDMDTGGVTLPEAVNLIRGEKNSIITLTFQHDGDSEPYTIDLKRETIVVPSVEVKFGYLDNEGKWQEVKEGETKPGMVAWLKLSRFGDLTAAQWDEAVAKINDQCPMTNAQCKGVVLDLRNNPGGYLSGAVNLAAEFLPKNTLVVRQENADGTTQEYKTERIGRLNNISLIIMLNKGSASASEILAGALRDNKRAKIVGEQSFGKGTVQEALDLRGGAGLHVTTAKWLLPKGGWIHENGITPDVVVEPDEKNQTRDVQLEKAASQLNQ